MTHDFKSALDDFTNDDVSKAAHKHFETIRHALTIAAEYEQVKKERDALAEGFNDMIERTVSCGGTLYLGHAGQRAREIAKKVSEENGKI